MTPSQKVAAHFHITASAFDAIYSRDKTRILRLWDDLTRQNIYKRFQFTKIALAPIAGKSILDVGCGSGRYCVEFARWGAARVVGVDFAENMIRLANELAFRNSVSHICEFVMAEILDYRPSEYYDAVVAMGLFDYVGEPRRVMKRLRQMTGAMLVAAFPARMAFRVPFRKLYLRLHGCPVYFFNEGEIRQLCQEADFEPVVLRRSGPIYLLIATPAMGDGRAS